MRASGSVCPFCAAPLIATQSVPSANVGGRLARGALFAFATTVITTGIVSGCSSTETGPGTTSDAATDTRANDDTGGTAPAYGAPADTGVAPDTSGDGTVDDSGGGMAKYGAPPPPDDAATPG